MLATSLLRLGRADEGNRELEVYQRLQPEATALQSKRLEIAALRRDATVSAANGDHERAVALLRKALEAEPADPAAELDLGLALLRAGKAAEAIPHLRAGVVPARRPTCTAISPRPTRPPGRPTTAGANARSTRRRARTRCGAPEPSR